LAGSIFNAENSPSAPSSKLILERFTEFISPIPLAAERIFSYKLPFSPVKRP
jgi:hypothetical protein